MCLCPPPSEPTRAFLHELVSGIAHLHHIRIVHRDIKPHNVLLVERGGLGDEEGERAVRVRVCVCCCDAILVFGRLVFHGVLFLLQSVSCSRFMLWPVHLRYATIVLVSSAFVYPISSPVGE